MLVHIKCGDFQKEIFDEIEKNSIKLRNEECEHYYLSIKLSEGNNFEELILKIICKLCNNEKSGYFKIKKILSIIVVLIVSMTKFLFII